MRQRQPNSVAWYAFGRNQGLNTNFMEKFISTSSRNFRGGWKAYDKKLIENFEVII